MGWPVDRFLRTGMASTHLAWVTGANNTIRHCRHEWKKDTAKATIMSSVFDTCRVVKGIDAEGSKNLEPQW